MFTAVATCVAMGCRAPRDPDLDLRMAEARQKASAPAGEETEAPATKEAAKGKAQRAKGPHEPPPKGTVEQRVYTDDESKKILAKLPGSGSEILAEFETAKGTIHCKLDADAAPQAVTNFVALALGVRPWRDPDTGEVLRTRFYDGLRFHRTIANFIIQTGNPSAVRAGGPGWTLPRESGIPDAYEKAGVMGMVDAGTDTHGSQFFITVKPSTNLAKQYTPFGTCDDLELAKAISNADKLPPTKEGKSATRPKRPVTITKVRVVRQ